MSGDSDLIDAFDASSAAIPSLLSFLLSVVVSSCGTYQGLIGLQQTHFNARERK